MTSEEITLDTQIHHYLETYAESLELTDFTLHVTRGSGNGDNFIGLIYKVKIKGVKNGETKSIHLILKTMSSLESNGFFKPRNFFLREISFYREILPTFKKTLAKHGETIDFFPTFYDAINDESDNQALLLEDLTRKGFTMKDSKLMDYLHVSLAIKRLGVFHAYSFILRIADPVSFEKMKDLEDPMFERKYRNDPNILVKKETVDIVAKLLTEEGQHYGKRFKKYTDNMMRNIVDALDGRLAEPYAVVSHGDAWTNNILFKYDQEDRCNDKIPRDLCFLDLQYCRYASPATDITYMLFCSCTQETRIKYYDQLIQEYYEALSTCLKKFEYDPNVLFPYEALSQQLINFGQYAAGTVYMCLYYIVDSEVSEIKNVSPTKFQERIDNDRLYRETLKGALIDLIDRNYI